MLLFPPLLLLVPNVFTLLSSDVMELMRHENFVGGSVSWISAMDGRVGLPLALSLSVVLSASVPSKFAFLKPLRSNVSLSLMLRIYFVWFMLLKKKNVYVCVCVCAPVCMC